MMSFLEVASAAGVAAALITIFLAGWVVAGRNHRRELIEVYAGGKQAVRAVDLARLGALRRELEDERGGLSSAAAGLLYDVCQALRLDEGETQHVVGPAYWLALNLSVMDAEAVYQPPSLNSHILMVCGGCGKLAPADELRALGGQCQTCSFGWQPGDDGDVEEVW